MKTGFIGLGAMGMHMARNLAKANLLETVFNFMWESYVNRVWRRAIGVWSDVVPKAPPNDWSEGRRPEREALHRSLNSSISSILLFQIVCIV